MEEQSTCGSSTRKRPGEISGNGTNLDFDPSEEPMDREDPSATASEHLKNNRKKMKRTNSDDDSLKFPVRFVKLNQKCNLKINFSVGNLSFCQLYVFLSDCLTPNLSI
jgi:hypothetical protein